MRAAFVVVALVAAQVQAQKCESYKPPKDWPMPKYTQVQNITAKMGTVNRTSEFLDASFVDMDDEKAAVVVQTMADMSNLKALKIHDTFGKMTASR